jgi:LysR family hydrogen peroxide-inducible transcriptional activator
VEHALAPALGKPRHVRQLVSNAGGEDQALAFCSLRRIESINTFGASSLSTLVQMVVNDLGMTLLPELAVPLEARRGEIHLMRFADPEPQRTIGLAWRRSSPRKRHFVELGKMIEAAKAGSSNA